MGDGDLEIERCCRACRDAALVCAPLAGGAGVIEPRVERGGVSCPAWYIRIARGDWTGLACRRTVTAAGAAWGADRAGSAWTTARARPPSDGNGSPRRRAQAGVRR